MFTRPSMPYVGQDGNIFAILGRARAALRRAGNADQLAAFDADVKAAMQSGDVDYYGMINICLNYVDEADTEDDDEEEE